MTEWLTPATLRGQWAQAPANDVTAARLLAAGKEHVLSLAPELTGGSWANGYYEIDPDNVPDSYVLAQGMVARKIWEQQRANVGNPDELGTEPLTYQLGSSLRYAILDLVRPPRPPIGVG